MSDVVYLADNRGNRDFELFYQCTYFLTGMDYFDTGSSGQGFYAGIGVGAVIEGDLDLERVEGTMTRLFNEIDALRVCYPASEGDLTHFRIRDSYDFKLDVIETVGESFEERLHYATNEESRIVADIGNYAESACRAVVYDLGELPSQTHSWLLALTFNHMIIDDQGLILVWNQFMSYYRGEEERIANKKSLIDYYNYMNDHPDLYDRDEIVSYWAEQMYGYRTPPMRDPEGMKGLANFNLADYVVEYDISRLRKIASSCRITLPSLFVAAFHVASARTFGVHDSVVTIGTEARPSFEFWSTVVHSLVSMNNRIEVRGDETFAELARRTLAKMSENIRHAPSQELVGGISHLGITYANQPESPNLGEGLVCRPWMPVTVVADNRTEPKEFILPPKQLMVGIVEHGDIVRTECAFTPLSFSMADAKDLSEGMELCITMLEEDPQVRVSRILGS